MLTITLPESEWYDDRMQEFVYFKPVTLTLEHSLLAISKWESKWKKPFLSREEKTSEEFIDYIKCMTVTSNVSPDAYSRLGRKEFAEIEQYIMDPMTATTFTDRQQNRKVGKKEQITSELIYYWMDVSGIPYEAQKWHLNRLMTLIRIHDIKDNGQNNKMSKKDVLNHNKALNAQRRAKSGSHG